MWVLGVRMMGSSVIVVRGHVHVVDAGEAGHGDGHVDVGER